MNNRSLLLWGVALLPALYLSTIYADLPDVIPIHYDLAGQPDRWGSKAWLWLLALLGPGLMAAIFTLLLDRQLASIPAGKRWRFALVSTLGMSLLFGFLLHLTYLGRSPGTGALLALLGGYFAALGNYFPVLPRNRWVGIRTARTLASEAVWRRVHRFGGRLWVVAGLLAVVAGLLIPGRYAGYGCLLFAVVVAVPPLVYSYRVRTDDDDLV